MYNSSHSVSHSIQFYGWKSFSNRLYFICNVCVYTFTHSTTQSNILWYVIQDSSSIILRSYRHLLVKRVWMRVNLKEEERERRETDRIKSLLACQDIFISYSVMRKSGKLREKHLREKKRASESGVWKLTTYIYHIKRMNITFESERVCVCVRWCFLRKWATQREEGKVLRVSKSYAMLRKS